MIITLQPAARVDRITEDGAQLTQLPYPFHVNEKGDVLRQDVWRGDPARVVGFVADLARQEVDLYWFQVVDNPDQAIGMYLITSDAAGNFGTHLAAIDSVTVQD